MKKTLLISAISLFSIVIVIVVVAYCYIVNAAPLKSYGHSDYNFEDKVIMELKNEGKSKIRLTDVLVNDTKPVDAKLIISYTGRLVLAGIENEPYAKFLEIHEQPIKSDLSSDQALRIIREGEHTTPISYGIQVVNDEEIRSVTIKYKYYGITKKAKFVIVSS